MRIEHANQKEPGAGQFEEEVTPVKMVRPANPYADVPSLYDMYVQAAVSQRPAERFGIEVFRNTDKSARRDSHGPARRARLRSRNGR